MKKINYGILSTASIVPRFIQGMRLTNNGAIKAIASRDMTKAKAFAQNYNIEKAYGSYEDLLSDPDIDAVYIPLINSLHYEYAKKSLVNNKHVILEKPFVLHPEDAVELAEIAKERHLFLTEAVKTPYLPIYQKIKEIIKQKIYGNIRYMDFRQSYTSGPYITGWNTMKEYGGGVFISNEAYYFTMAEFLGGKVLSCNGSATFGKNGTEDQCCVTSLLENDILAQMNVSTRILFNNGLTIYFDHARIEIPDFWKATVAYIYLNNQLIDTLSFPCKYEFQYELQYYNECIQNGILSSPVTPVENTIRYIQFCNEIYTSWDRNNI